MIKYKKGNLLEATEDIIAHGVNCIGGFGSGVAGQIAKKYPEARKHYLEKYVSKDGWELGEIQYSHQADGKIIANCATQFSYLPRGICHADYLAIKQCMENLKYVASPNFTIAIPKIGAGLAGGDWSIIEPILFDIFNDYDITIYTID